MGPEDSGIRYREAVVKRLEGDTAARARSRERIERYISELEAIKNYDKVKRERDEALKKADPVALLKNIINELRKPEAEQDFPQEIIDSGVVKEIEQLMNEMVERKIHVRILIDRASRAKE